MTATVDRSTLGFWRNVRMRVGGECWPWLGNVDSCGYGLWVEPDGTRWMAHRRAFSLAVRPILAGMQLDHVCRLRGCVNPAHLEEVSRSQNARRKPSVQIKDTGPCWEQPELLAG